MLGANSVTGPLRDSITERKMIGMKKKLRILGTVAIASSLVLSAVPSVSAATTTTSSSVETGRTQLGVATGVIKVDSLQINKKSLTGTVLIDGPRNRHREQY